MERVVLNLYPKHEFAVPQNIPSVSMTIETVAIGIELTMRKNDVQ